MNTTIKLVGAAVKVAIIAAAVTKICVFAKLAHTIAKVDTNNSDSNNNDNTNNN